MATIHDVARVSGVSISTVSTVLTGAKRPVSTHLRQRVIRTAEQLNYHPNAMAQALVRRRVGAIGVLSGIFAATDIVTNSYAARVMEGIIEAASDAKQNINLFTQFWRGAEESKTMFRDRRADGLILISPPTTSDIVHAVAALGFPLVTVSAQVIDSVPTVDVDDIAGARLATAHLIALGHRRIAHIHGDMDLVSATARVQGFSQAMEAAGLAIPEGFVAGASYNGSGAQQVASCLLRRSDRPTAIFAGNDNMAVAVMQAALGLGLQIARDLSVVGYDDAPVASLVMPGLTTVHQPLQKIGHRAATLLLELIDGNQVAPKSYVMAPDLVVRHTTAPPR